MKIQDMKLLIITTLCIALSTFVPPCASQKTLAHLPHEQTHYMVFTLAKLPRKLRPIEVPMVQDSMNRDHKSNSASNGASSVKKPYGRETVDIKENEMWRLMTTMDYSRPRRRRPIHNKVVPVAP